MSITVNYPEQLPADSHDNSTRSQSYVNGKLTEVHSVTLKPVTPTGKSGKLVYTNGVLTSRTDAT